MSGILVTGASGKLGTVVCQTLRDAGKSFRATDRVRSAPLPANFHRANLLSAPACRRLVQDVETVIHLGNVPSENFPARRCLDENVIINRQLFEVAAQAGVRRMIFASSLQIIALPTGTFPALPIDETTPASPQNFYALSKQCSEQALALFCRQYGMAGIALRWPTLVYHPGADGLASWLRQKLSQGFGYLTYRDAAELILTLVDADLPGYRHYVPTSRHNALHLPAEEVLRDYYPGVTLRKELTSLGSLFDHTLLARETGWIPGDLCSPEPTARLSWKQRWRSGPRARLLRAARGIRRRLPWTWPGKSDSR